MAGEEAVTLVERLRAMGRVPGSSQWVTEAADRIEELERELAGLQHTLDGLMER